MVKKTSIIALKKKKPFAVIQSLMGRKRNDKDAEKIKEGERDRRDTGRKSQKGR